jgi:hypothetical protein
MVNRASIGRSIGIDAWGKGEVDCKEGSVLASLSILPFAAWIAGAGRHFLSRNAAK